MLMYLRIAVTALSLTACVFSIAMWVRSYTYEDRFVGPSRTSGMIFLTSKRGEFENNWDSKIKSSDRLWHFSTWPVRQSDRNPLSMVLGYFHFSSSSVSIVVPYWAALLVTATLALLPWIRKIEWRFSVRALLIAMSVVAFGLGIIVAAQSDGDMEWFTMLAFPLWVLAAVASAAGLVRMAGNSIEAMRRGQWQFSLRAVLIVAALILLMLGVVMVPFRLLTYFY